MLENCMGGVFIEKPKEKISCKTVWSISSNVGYEKWFDYFLANVHKSCIEDLLICVFIINGSSGDTSDKIIDKYKNLNILRINCYSPNGLGIFVKSVVYSTAQMIDAEHYIFGDSDFIVVGSLEGVIKEVEANPGYILGVHAQDKIGGSYCSLAEIAHNCYRISIQELKSAGYKDKELSENCYLNAGMIAGDKTAVTAVEELVRAMPNKVFFQKKKDYCFILDELFYNLGIAQYGKYKIIDYRYNFFMWKADELEKDGTIYLHEGKPVSALHFLSSTKSLIDDYVD